MTYAKALCRSKLESYIGGHSGFLFTPSSEEDSSLSAQREPGDAVITAQQLFEHEGLSYFLPLAIFK